MVNIFIKHVNLIVITKNRHSFVFNLHICWGYENNVDVDDRHTDGHTDSIYHGNTNTHSDAHDWAGVVIRGTIGGRNVRIFTDSTAYRKDMIRLSRKLIIFLNTKKWYICMRGYNLLHNILQRGYSRPECQGASEANIFPIFRENKSVL